MKSQKCSVCEKKMKWNPLLESWECHNKKCPNYIYTKNVKDDIEIDLPSPAQSVLDCVASNNRGK